MKSHILETNFTSVLGVVVESVQFSIEVRQFVAHIAKALLSELNYGDYKAREAELGRVYAKIQDVFYFFNVNTHINSMQIRNAIRVLDMRINHCENSLKIGDWTKADSHPQHFEGITEKTRDSYIRKDFGIFATLYNGKTMEVMLATRQILVDSLITITPEFE
jgi:hypothetical protein